MTRHLLRVDIPQLSLFNQKKLDEGIAESVGKRTSCECVAPDEFIVTATSMPAYIIGSLFAHHLNGRSLAGQWWHSSICLLGGGGLKEIII